jgi:hypothetical protein
VEFPGHIIRITGIKDPKIGTIKKGESFGKASRVNISFLQKQSKGFALIEIRRSVLDQMFR